MNTAANKGYNKLRVLAYLWSFVCSTIIRVGWL